jgi:hypothetical protein
VLIAPASQPRAPRAAQRSKSAAGGSSAIIVLCDEQPPRMRARACLMCELPRDCGTLV